MENKRKLDEFEFVLHKTRHRTDGIDEINKKIFDMDRKYDVKFCETDGKLIDFDTRISGVQD